MRTWPWLVAMWCLVAAPPARAADDVNRLLREIIAGGPSGDSAMERLKFLGPEKAGPALRTLLKSEFVRVRIASSAALAIVRDRDASAALVEHLGDEDWEVRRNCANALGAIRAKGATKALGTTLASDANARVRKACALALGEIGGAGSTLSRAAAKDKDLEVRLAALDAVARTMDGSASAGLRPLLTDASGMVRFAAARALAWCGDSSAKPFFSQAISGTDDEARGRSVTVLADVPRSWAADLLAKVLTGADVELADNAAQALARRQDKRGLKHLATLEVAGGFRGAKASAMLDQLGVTAAERKAFAEARP